MMYLANSGAIFAFDFGTKMLHGLECSAVLAKAKINCVCGAYRVLVLVELQMSMLIYIAFVVARMTNDVSRELCIIYIRVCVRCVCAPFSHLHSSREILNRISNIRKFS